MLSEAAVQDLTILGLDVSAAFMASPLGRKLGKRIRVILKFPPNITHKDGSPVFLEAWKAINGLRSSGRAWVDHLSALLQRLNIVPSSVESTVFAGEIDGKNGKAWVQVVAYVDDLLVFSASKEHVYAVYDFLSKHLKIKK